MRIGASLDIRYALGEFYLTYRDFYLMHFLLCQLRQNKLAFFDALF